MASTSGRSSNSSARAGGGGAAAEPEPSASTESTGYTVRDYQNPDAGAADQPVTKGKGKGAGKTKGKGQIFVCFHCGKSGAKLRSCSQCHRAYYCDRECQRRDWPRHKPACKAAVAAEAKRATRRAAWKAAAAAARREGGSGGKVVCVICIGAAVAPVELPCILRGVPR